MFYAELKIPRERVAVLIGIKAETKKRLERRAKGKLVINSESGDVVLEADDISKGMALENIVRAIGRGFNPEIAENLFNEDFVFEVVNIREHIKTRNDLVRVKARLIGTKGKARENFEILSNTNISIYGKTVAIIGKFENIGYARQAIVSLIEGAPHDNVYRYLERARAKSEREEF